MNNQKFVDELIHWYHRSGRDLPWRRTQDPYAIWVSEIMLQQTQVETVKPYYERFLKMLPTIGALAGAPEEQVIKLWEGLGYYRRARYLKEAAEDIETNYHGTFPTTYDDILKLKGIGPYTASAISSIVFKAPKGVIDGNTLRIISRIFNRQDNIAQEKTKKLYREIMDNWINLGHPADFNQGMMDLGATICTFRKPQCDRCPVAKHCQAFAADTVRLLPINIKNTTKTDLYYITAIIKYKDQYFLIKNKDGLLENLYGLIQYEVESPFAFEEAFYTQYGVQVRLLEYLKDIKHVFSHRIWNMSVYYGELHTEDGKLSNANLYTPDQLKALPISTAHQKVLNIIHQ